MILLLLTLASLLELLDFPPLLRALDAHSLWHLSTVPIASMWYDWLIQDAQECVSLGFWIGEPSHLPAQGEKLLNGPLVLGALQRAKSWTRNNVPAKLQRGSTRVNSLELKALTSSSYGLVSIFLYLSVQSRVLEGVGFSFLSSNFGPLWGRPNAYAGGLGRGTWWTRFQIIRYDFTNLHAFLLLSRKVSFSLS